MPQYVKVVYPEQRAVYVGGQTMGRTNRRIEIGRGTYTITLGKPQDYSPSRRRVTVRRTRPDDPLIVTFEKTGGGIT